ncbi:MAG: hypothetical protein HGB18_05125 [Candidatus Moranbacteria bacterium]|nr:hypothetical protein [Candidatus Moranbacteria bacterium]
MPEKKKIPAPREPVVEHAVEPRKNTAAARSSRRKGKSERTKPVVSRSDAVSVEKKIGRRDFAIIMLWVAGSVFLLSALGAAAYYYRAYRHATDVKSPVNETEQLVIRLSRFMELPSEETPTLATVTDKTKLAGQDFFTNAENGDKVLIYQVAGKAILFRPSSGKIVNVAPVNTKEDSGNESQADISRSEDATAKDEDGSAGQREVGEQEAQEVAPADKVGVELLNGSGTVGVTADVERRILGRYADTMEVIGKGMASKKDYEGIQIIDLSGSRAQQAADLAMFLGGSVLDSGLPDGEKVPDGTDLLVIVGNPATASSSPASE